MVNWDFTDIQLTKPTRTFDNELTLDLDGLEIRLIEVGPSHTAGDVIVYVPDRGVVFAGDVLFSKCTPVGWNGSYEKWIAALDRIIAFKPDVIVPGHGPLCGIEGAQELKAYFQHVRRKFSFVL